MATCIFSLSKSIDPNTNESVIFCQVGITRTKRPKFSTYISVSPKDFKDGEIILPKKRDPLLEEKKFLLSDFASRMNRIVDYIQQKLANGGLEISDITASYLADLSMLCRDGSVISLTYETIDMRIRAREEVKRLKQEAEKKVEMPKRDIFDLLEIYVKADDHKNGQFSYDEIKHVRALSRMLRRWVEYIRFTKDASYSIDIDTMKSDEVRSFIDYVREEGTLAKRYEKFFSDLFKKYPVASNNKSCLIAKRGENTIVKIRKKFKTFFGWLHKRGLTTNDPFKGVVIGSEKYGIPYYLTVEERNYLAEYDFSSKPRLELQRDIFIFQCHVGCRVSDLYKMTEALIGDDKVLRYVPHKTKDETGTMAIVPLTEVALSLIDKYRGKDSKGRLFPFVSTQKYNVYIKEAFEIAGLSRMVPVRNPQTGETVMTPLHETASSHMARRVFTASAYTQVQDPNIVGKMTGHSEGSKAFARYNTIGEDILASVVRSDKFMGTISVKDELHKLIDGLTNEQAEVVRNFILEL